MSSRKNEQQEIFEQIGHMTRTLHSTLLELGEENLHLARAAESIPGTRERLAYVLSMTEQAVSRVLNAVDMLTPMLDQSHDKAGALLALWASTAGQRRDSQAYQSLMAETHQFLQQAVRNGETSKNHLMEIVMAQEFQDLTGQVIKKIADVAARMETDLLLLLQKTQPMMAGKKTVAKKDTLLNGPAMQSDIQEHNALSSQAEVDKFLDQLGF